ncbi:hypothetical protein PCANC_02564 [Puccinia coronata f. sp. avenae]|uniref:Uncharacterized protein n=1 Tax=Puccinia coronata f. sp. avenae TaxID=200324 RepID=A0A2N5VYI4_9BASI|nr:hypothetical protein PCANC_02564 [Puccinia coronata f. sp. avenae]
MPSEAQATWSGTLKSKKKSELQQICRQLNIEYKSESLKADLEQQIRHRFKEVPSLQEDDRFARLDHTGSPTPSSNASVPASRRTRARSISRPPRANDEDQPSSTRDDGARPTRSPSRRTALDSNATEPDSSGTQKILVAVVNTEKERSRHTTSKNQAVATASSTQAQQLAKQTSHQVIESFNAFSHFVARETVNGIQIMQRTFSSPWKLCVIAILAELAFVVYSTVPHRQAIYVGLKQDGYSIHIPEPIVRLFHRIFSQSFMKPFLGYLGVTVIAPFVVGGLMNVPNANQASAASKPKFKATRDLKPNVFVYCAARLAALALVHLVFYPDYHFGWATPSTKSRPHLHPSPLLEEDAPLSKHSARNLHLNGFEYLQYVTTTFGMLIALYQLIRSAV